MRYFVKKQTPKIYLRDSQTALMEYWKKYFHAFDVDIAHSDIMEVKADAIVSPANSFGFMTGGIDLLYKYRFGPDVEKLVQKNIDLHYYGELPVGQALSVPMRNQSFKYLIAAPTMRLPMIVDNTMNPYLAFRAALLEAKELGIESVACPGLGTGSGKACLEMVARQMLMAYVSVVLQKSPTKMEDLAKQMNWMLRCSKDKKVWGV